MTRKLISPFLGGLVIIVLVMLWAVNGRRSRAIDLEPHQLAQAVNAFWKNTQTRRQALPPTVTVKELVALGYLQSGAVRSAGASDAAVRLWLDVEKPGMLFMKVFQPDELRLVRQEPGGSLRVGFTGYTNSFGRVHAGFVITNVSRRAVYLREYQITPGPYRQQCGATFLLPGKVHQVLFQAPVTDEPWQLAVEYQQEISPFSPESIQRLKFGVFRLWKDNAVNTNRHEYVMGERVTYVAGIISQPPLRADQGTEDGRFTDGTERISAGKQPATGPRPRLADERETPGR